MRLRSKPGGRIVDGEPQSANASNWVGKPPVPPHLPPTENVARGVIHAGRTPPYHWLQNAPRVSPSDPLASSSTLAPQRPVVRRSSARTRDVPSAREKRVSFESASTLAAPAPRSTSTR